MPPGTISQCSKPLFLFAERVFLEVSLTRQRAETANPPSVAWLALMLRKYSLSAPSEDVESNMSFYLFDAVAGNSSNYLFVLARDKSESSIGTTKALKIDIQATIAQLEQGGIV